MKGRMPIQAKANGLTLDEIPSELSHLNSLDLRNVHPIYENGCLATWATMFLFMDQLSIYLLILL